MLSDIAEQIAIGFLRTIGFILAVIFIILILKFTGLLDKLIFYKILF